MNLYDFIFKRKSTRKYDMTPLDSQTINTIVAFAGNLKRLYPDIKTSYELTSSVNNLLPVKAPHYFVLSSEKKQGDLHNIGFMWQQMDLFLSSMGIGSCWLGMAKPQNEPKTELTFVIILAFGRCEKSPYRELSGFNRKPTDEISSGVDSRIEAARLAPSATNSQNWFFEAEGGKIHVFQKKLNPAMAVFYSKMNSVDIGIALCHLYIATQKEGKDFEFLALPAIEKKGYIYIGTVI